MEERVSKFSGLSAAATQREFHQAKKNSVVGCGGIFRNLCRHLKYQFHRTPKSNTVALADWKTLMTRLDILLAEDVATDLSTKSADLVKSASDRHMKKLLRTCACILKDTGASYARKMNTMQFVMGMALTNEYNAYKVACSRAISAIYKLGTINSERDGHKVFGDHANKAQILKCSIYAKSVIEALSRPASFSEDLQNRMPFGVEYLMAKCNKFRKQYLLVGVAALQSRVSIHDANNASSICPSINNPPAPGLSTKSYQARAKEIEYRVSLVEDEMRELGVGRGRKLSSERQEDMNGEDPYSRVVDLVSRLYHLNGESDALLQEVIEAADSGLKDEVTKLINRIDTLKGECRGKYIDESPASSNANSLALTFNALNSISQQEEEMFHSPREYMDVSYVTNLSAGDGMSAYTLKSAKTEHTAKEAFTDAATVMDDVEMEEVIEQDDDRSSTTAEEAPKVKNNDEACMVMRIADSKEPIPRGSSQASESKANADQHYKKETTLVSSGDKGNESSEAISAEPTMAEMRELYELELVSKVENTDCIVSSALNMLDVLRGFLSRGASITSLMTLENIAAAKGEVKTLSEQSTSNESGMPQGRRDTPRRIESSQDSVVEVKKLATWTSDNESVTADGSPEDGKKQVGAAKSNMNEIRQIFITGHDELYRDDDLKVDFRQQLMSEGTGKVLHCQVKVTNTSNQTIQIMEFDSTNFEHFPLHMEQEGAREAEAIPPNGSRTIRFRLYPLAPFIGLPRIKILNTIAGGAEKTEYLIYLPIPITSFLVAETGGDKGTVDALQATSKTYFMITNTAEFEKLVTLATFNGQFKSFKLADDPNAVYILGSLHQSQYENSKNECLSRHSVLVKLEPVEDSTSFNLSVYSKSERLAGAVARLFKYLFHNRGDAYDVVR